MGASERSGEQFDVHPNQITIWRSQLLEGAAGVFGSDARTEPVARAIDVKTLRDLLGAEGVRVGRLHVATLMKKMGVAAIYRRPNTSMPGPTRCEPPRTIRVR